MESGAPLNIWMSCLPRFRRPVMSLEWWILYHPHPPTPTPTHTHTHRHRHRHRNTDTDTDTETHTHTLSHHTIWIHLDLYHYHSIYFQRGRARNLQVFLKPGVVKRSTGWFSGRPFCYSVVNGGSRLGTMVGQPISPNSPIRLYQLGSQEATQSFPTAW